MRYPFLIAVVLALLVIGIPGQSLRDDELSVEFTARARNVDIVVPNSNTLTKDNLSLGFKASYAHCFGRKGGRGDVCAGVEGGPTFRVGDNSGLSLMRGAYFMKLQANGNKRFQPFIKGSVGLACDHWSKKGPNNPRNTGCPALSYGGGVGFDTPFKEGSRRKWRVGFEYFTTNFRNPLEGFQRTLQHNFEASTGIVF